MLSPAALLASAVPMLLSMSPLAAASDWLMNDCIKTRTCRPVVKPKPRVVKTPCTEQIRQQRRYILM